MIIKNILENNLDNENQLNIILNDNIILYEFLLIKIQNIVNYLYYLINNNKCKEAINEINYIKDYLFIEINKKYKININNNEIIKSKILNLIDKIIIDLINLLIKEYYNQIFIYKNNILIYLKDIKANYCNTIIYDNYDMINYDRSFRKYFNYINNILKKINNYNLLINKLINQLNNKNINIDNINNFKLFLNNFKKIITFSFNKEEITLEKFINEQIINLNYIIYN